MGSLTLLLVRNKGNGYHPRICFPNQGSLLSFQSGRNVTAKPKACPNIFAIVIRDVVRILSVIGDLADGTQSRLVKAYCVSNLGEPKFDQSLKLTKWGRKRSICNNLVLYKKRVYDRLAHYCKGFDELDELDEAQHKALHRHYQRSEIWV